MLCNAKANTTILVHRYTSFIAHIKEYCMQYKVFPDVVISVEQKHRFILYDHCK